ncbi:hypothetical protein [uncultured Roseibium sp.]|uniref:hypothetical protein n=1 Tax=uncultured Roseibium sp. TaxID=1936171 RepID=UPI002609B104|nr:hypothetical protein [uncultured Roseibium sp.]
MPRYTKRIASEILRDPRRSKAAKIARGEALTQRSCLTDDDRIHEDETLLPALTVSDHEAVPIGVLDADGNEFMRLPERIGFHWKD